MSDLVARVLAQRECWVDLGGGLAVRIRRPDALARARMAGMDRSAVIEAAIASAVNWRGITEASVLGAAHGSDAVVAFVRPIACNCVCFVLRHGLPYSLVYALDLLAESRQLLIVLAALRGRSQACSSRIPFGWKRKYGGEKGK